MKCPEPVTTLDRTDEAIAMERVRVGGLKRAKVETACWRAEFEESVKLTKHSCCGSLCVLIDFDSTRLSALQVQCILCGCV